MNPLGFIGMLNPKVILGVVITVALAAAVWWFGHMQYTDGVADGTATATKGFNVEKSAWLNEKATAISTAVKAVQDRLDETQRRVTAQEGIIHDAQQQTTRATAAAAAAHRVGDGLREQLVNFVATSRGGAGCGDTGTAPGSTAADDLGVLAAVLRETDGFAEAAAAEADANRIAGLACQRSYTALKVATAPTPAASAASVPDAP